MLGAALSACAPNGDISIVGKAGSRPNASVQPVLSKSELHGTCLQLEQVVQAEVREMIGLREKARLERETAPPTIVKAWQRTFGADGDGLVAIEEYRAKHARIRAINSELASRKCPVVDIEAALSAPMGRGVSR